jgi:hypothetical protein
MYNKLIKYQNKLNYIKYGGAYNMLRNLDLLISNIDDFKADIIYFGIGSSPSDKYMESYKPYPEPYPTEDHQIFPPFLEEYSRKIIINVDPLNSQEYIDFYKDFYRRKNFPLISEDYTSLVWRNDTNIVIHLLSNFDISTRDDQDIVNYLITKTLTDNCKLIVQNYSGGYNNWYLQFIKSKYAESSESEKILYRNNILFDFFYYPDAACSGGNLYENKPLIDSEGNFINFLFMNNDEAFHIFRQIGRNPRIIEIIKKKIIKEFKDIQDIDIQRLRNAYTDDKLNIIREKLRKYILREAELNNLSRDDTDLKMEQVNNWPEAIYRNQKSAHNISIYRL